MNKNYRKNNKRLEQKKIIFTKGIFQCKLFKIISVVFMVVFLSIISSGLFYTDNANALGGTSYSVEQLKEAYSLCESVGGKAFVISTGMGVDLITASASREHIKADGKYEDSKYDGEKMGIFGCENAYIGDRIIAMDLKELRRVVDDIKISKKVGAICKAIDGEFGFSSTTFMFDTTNVYAAKRQDFWNNYINMVTQSIGSSCNVPAKYLPKEECLEGKNGMTQMGGSNYTHCLMYSKDSYKARGDGFGEVKNLLSKLHSIMKDNNIIPKNKDDCEAMGYRWVPGFSTQPAYCATTNESGEEIDITEGLGIEEDNDTKSTCAIGGGLGFIICPVMTTAGDMMGSLYDYVLGSMLEIEASTFGSEGVKAATNAILPIANLVLAILFLLVIYSEATGGGFGGLSNYNLKKTLPRLIIFAVMINISFYICAAAIDISNIFGSGIANFFDEIKSTIALNGSGGTTGSAIGAAVGLTALVGTVVAASLIFAGPAVIAAIFPVVLAGLAAVISTLLILLIRKVAIVALVVLSPVAFAMAILPNTKSLFNKWLGMFKSMLIVYPTIGLVIGASGLLSAIVGNTASDLSGLEELMTNIAAIGAAVLPLFAVPVVAKGALNGLGKMGTMLTKGVNTASFNNMAQKNMRTETGNALKRTPGYKMAVNSKNVRKNRLDGKATGRNANFAKKIKKTGFGDSRLGKLTGLDETLNKMELGRGVEDNEADLAEMRAAEAFVGEKMKTISDPSDIYNIIESGKLNGENLSEYQVRAFVKKGMPSMDTHQIEGILAMASQSNSSALRDTVSDSVKETSYNMSGTAHAKFKTMTNSGLDAYNRQTVAQDQLSSIDSLKGGDKMIKALRESAGTSTGSNSSGGAWSAGSGTGDMTGEENYSDMIRKNSMLDIVNASKEKGQSESVNLKKIFDQQETKQLHEDVTNDLTESYAGRGETFDINKKGHLEHFNLEIERRTKFR